MLMNMMVGLKKFLEVSVDIKIKYCVVWNYEPKARSLRDELNEEFGYWAKLVPGDRGAFEVYVNGVEVFSKLNLDRFPSEREITRLIHKL